MKNYLFLLAVSALLGQCNEAIAQSATSQGQQANLLLLPVIRSSVVKDSVSVSKPAGAKAVGVTNNPSGAKAAGMAQADLKRCCERIIHDVQRVYFLNDKNGKIRLQVRGVYAHGGALFFLLLLNNRSPLDYDVDSVRFLVTAVARGRQPPEAIKVLDPVYVYDSTAMIPGATTIPGHSRVVTVFVLPRFTLPTGRQLVIDVRERNGGRHLKVQATNWTLERARLI